MFSSASSTFHSQNSPSSSDLEQSELCMRLRAVGIDVEKDTRTNPEIDSCSPPKTTTKMNTTESGDDDEGYHSRTSTISSTSSTAPEEEIVENCEGNSTSVTNPPLPALLLVDVPDSWLLSSSQSADEAGVKEEHQSFMRTTMRRRKRLSLALEEEAEEDSEIFYEESEALLQMFLPRPLTPLDKLRKTVAEHIGLHFIFPDTRKGSNRNNTKKAQSAKLHRRRQSVTEDLYWQILLQALKDTAIL